MSETTRTMIDLVYWAIACTGIGCAVIGSVSAILRHKEKVRNDRNEATIAGLNDVLDVAQSENKRLEASLRDAREKQSAMEEERDKAIIAAGEAAVYNLDSGKLGKWLDSFEDMDEDVFAQKVADRVMARLSQSRLEVVSVEEDEENWTEERRDHQNYLLDTLAKMAELERASFDFPFQDECQRLYIGALAHSRRIWATRRGAIYQDGDRIGFVHDLHVRLFPEVVVDGTYLLSMWEEASRWGGPESEGEYWDNRKLLRERLIKMHALEAEGYGDVDTGLMYTVINHALRPGDKVGAHHLAVSKEDPKKLAYLKNPEDGISGCRTKVGFERYVLRALKEHAPKCYSAEELEEKAARATLLWDKVVSEEREGRREKGLIGPARND